MTPQKKNAFHTTKLKKKKETTQNNTVSFNQQHH